MRRQCPSFVVLLLLAGASCGGSDDGGGVDARPAGARCGDSVCSAGLESCSSCAADCGQCTGCVLGDGTCVGETICISNACQNAFGRTYRVTVSDVAIKTTNPSGDPWDAVGGAPDPFVVVTLNGSVVLTTTEQADTFNPVFSDQANVVVPAGASLEISMVDSDISSNDAIMSCVANPFPADFLRGGGVRCDGSAANGTNGTTLSVFFAAN